MIDQQYSFPCSDKKGVKQVIPFAISCLCFLMAGCGMETNTGTTVSNPKPTIQHILFVGDSFTHGRYLPVRTYNNTPNTGGLGSTSASSQVVDENFNTTVAERAESQPGETGPWGGIPGIFAEFAQEVGLPFDVHIEAISETPLVKNYAVAQSVIDQPLWDSVVLQEATFQPLPVALSKDKNSNPSVFCNAVQTIEQGVHGIAPKASIYLYQTGTPADTAYEDSYTTAFSDKAYLNSLQQIGDAYHDAYLSAAVMDGHIAGIAAAGDAWFRAWNEGIANPDPYGGSAPGVSLTFNFQPDSEPKTTDDPTDAGFHHPSIYGAYLSGLVLFEKITGVDVRTLGGNEQAAAALGISPTITVQLQQVAWESIVQQNNQPINPNVNFCSLTH